MSARCDAPAPPRDVATQQGRGCRRGRARPAATMPCTRDRPPPAVRTDDVQRVGQGAAQPGDEARCCTTCGQRSARTRSRSRTAISSATLPPDPAAAPPTPASRRGRRAGRTGRRGPHRAPARRRGRRGHPPRPAPCGSIARRTAVRARPRPPGPAPAREGPRQHERAGGRQVPVGVGQRQVGQPRQVAGLHRSVVQRDRHEREHRLRQLFRIVVVEAAATASRVTPSLQHRAGGDHGGAQPLEQRVGGARVDHPQPVRRQRGQRGRRARGRRSASSARARRGPPDRRRAAPAGRRATRGRRVVRQRHQPVVEPAPPSGIGLERQRVDDVGDGQLLHTEHPQARPGPRGAATRPATRGASGGEHSAGGRRRRRPGPPRHAGERGGARRPRSADRSRGTSGSRRTTRRAALRPGARPEPGRDEAGDVVAGDRAQAQQLGRRRSRTPGRAGRSSGPAATCRRDGSSGNVASSSPGRLSGSSVGVGA